MKIIISIIILASCFSNAYANDKLSQYHLDNGYDFERICAHGKYADSYFNYGLCSSVIKNSFHAYLLAIKYKYNGDTMMCYFKSYDDLSNMNLIMGIKRVERFYSQYPKYLEMNISAANFLSMMKNYPIPKKCLSR